MTNSEWLSWFFYSEPWFLAPVRIFVYFLFIAGVFIIGLAKRNLKYILFGIALLSYVVASVITSHIALRAFLEFKLLPVKLLYMFSLCVLVIFSFIAVQINTKRKNKRIKEQNGTAL